MDPVSASFLLGGTGSGAGMGVLGSLGGGGAGALSGIANPVVLGGIGGPVAGYFADRKEAKRRARVLEEAQRRREAITNRLLAGLAANAQAKQGAMGAHLGRYGSAELTDAARGRASAVDQAMRTAAVGASPVTGEGAAAYRQSMDRLAPVREAASASRLLAALQGLRDRSGERVNLTSINAGVGNQEQRSVADYQMNELQSWLQRELGDVPNSYYNMKLLSALGNSAAQGGMQMAAMG